MGTMVGARHPGADSQVEHDCSLSGPAAAGGLGHHDIDGGRGVAVPYSYFTSAGGRSDCVRLVDGRTAAACSVSDEWKFKAPEGGESADMDTMSPGERMRALEIVQEGDPILGEVARRFDLPKEAEDARRVVAQLVGMMERVGQ